MNNDVIVSVIVPMYNSSNYIDKFLKCMFAQTFNDWELIMVDDGSDDDTVEKIKKFQKKDCRIRLIVRDRLPKGSVVCRNIGQKNSVGKYIIHFDSDDYISINCLEQRVNFMENNKDIEYATFKGKSVIEDKNGKIREVGEVWGIDPNETLLECFLKVKYPFSVWNNIYRSNIFKEICWDEDVKIYTDFSYIVPVLIKKYKHAFADKCEFDYFYVTGRNNAMTSNFISNEKYNSTKYLFNKTMEQLKNLDDFYKYKKLFKKFFLLQFERILTSGNAVQIMDYLNFYNLHYGYSFRITVAIIINKLIFFIPNKRKFNKLIFMILFSQRHLFNHFKKYIL